MFFLMLILQSATTVFSQIPKELDAKKWANELSKKNYIHDKVYAKLDSILEYADTSHGIIFGGPYSLFIDSANVFNFLNALAEEGKSADDHFKVEFNCLKARAVYLINMKYNLLLVKKEVTQLLSSAMDIAYRSEDEYLIAFASGEYAQIIYHFGELGLAVMYSKNTIDLYEKLSIAIRPNDYQFLAEMLYKVREYSDCIRYGKKAVAAWKNSPGEFKRFTTSCINTVALGYHRQKMYDSAFIFYNQALQLAQQIHDTVWTAIVLGNMAQIYYAQGRYDTAYTLLFSDYMKSRAGGFYDNAGNSLQWAARANLARGNKATALNEVREAFQLFKLWPDAGYLRNAYYTSTQIFREMKMFDSAFYYNNLWSALNDSLEKVVVTSSLSISKARLNDETSRYNIQKLNREEKAELLKRNFIIAAIILISIIAFLFLNSSRVKLRLKQEIADAEVFAAKEKLQLFTENIIEKTSLIEKLEKQAGEKRSTNEQQEIIAALSSQTILTEADWEKFKTLYETIYPGFFTKLKTTITDITVAEQRMAALMRLHLTTRQMASLLGISPNSVNKTKQRLRQRFNLPADVNVEELIIKL
jgi:DNA-binding CsgD family transcriptional regulator